jgi:predicted alpha/beta superfamily hydrolase
MRPQFAVEVAYPGAARRVALRTELDWDRDVAPSSGDGDVAHFDLAADRPFLYFKPVLRDGMAMRWARGENRLALPDRPTRVQPFFAPDEHCSACDLRTIRSRELDAEVKLRVLLPSGYHENPHRRHSVAYMQDGNNVFFPDEAFLGRHWRVPEVVEKLDAMDLVEPPIIVGVQPGDRMAWYTDPGYRAYGRFLAVELKPYVDAAFRTLPGAARTAVIGSSLGGVASFYAAWSHPRRFGNAACLSSTFGYKDDLFARVEQDGVPPVRLYLDSGWPNDNYEATRAMRDRLLRRGLRSGCDLLYFAFPCATHDERAWAERVHLPFQFLFGETAPATAAVNPDAGLAAP